MGAGLLLALEVAGMLPQMISAGMNVWKTVAQIKAISASDTAPGSSERAALEAAIAIAEAEFDKQAKPRPPGT